MSSKPSHWLHAFHLRCLLWLCEMLLRPAIEGSSICCSRCLDRNRQCLAQPRDLSHAQLDLDTGKLSRPSLAAEVSGPGFLAMHPKGTHLYAAGSLAGVPSVIAFKIAQEGLAALQPFGSAAIGDGGATHLAISSNGRMLVTAQYGGGSVAVFHIDDQGRLSERHQLLEHMGEVRRWFRGGRMPHTRIGLAFLPISASSGCPIWEWMPS